MFSFYLFFLLVFLMISFFTSTFYFGIFFFLDKRPFKNYYFINRYSKLSCISVIKQENAERLFFSKAVKNIYIKTDLCSLFPSNFV